MGILIKYFFILYTFLNTYYPYSVSRLLSNRVTCVLYNRLNIFLCYFNYLYLEISKYILTHTHNNLTCAYARNLIYFLYKQNMPDTFLYRVIFFMGSGTAIPIHCIISSPSIGKSHAYNNNIKYNK